jgi:hypothetical protein
MADSSPTGSFPIGGKIGADDQQARNRTHQHYTFSAKGDGTTKLFPLGKTPSNSSQLMVYVSGLRMTASNRGTPNDYTIVGSTVMFATAPANAAPITFDLISS